MVPDLSAMPLAYFTTAAGPDSQDLYGPPGGLLDVYGDGTPLAQAESVVSHAGTGTGGGGVPWWQRADVVGFAMLVGGSFLVWRYLRAE